MKVEFFKHAIGDAEIKSLLQTLDGPFLTTGPRTAEFEKRLAAYLETQGAVGLSSWTNAAFLVLKAWGIGAGDEVIVPPMTFIASANVVLHCGAAPVFVDVEPETGNIDVAKVEEAVTPRTKAIIPVHLYGQLVDMKALRGIADRHGLKIFEDAAHALEGARDGYRPGQLGDAAGFSFYATKNITSGEGGAVVSQDQELLDQLRLLRLHGMDRSAADRYTARYRHWDMHCLGYKANMNDIQAALLLPQLERIEEQRERREEICRHYESEFSAAGVEFPRVRPDSRSARHLFTVWAQRGRRDDVLADLQEREIGVAVNFRAIHLLDYFRRELLCREGSFPVAEEIGDRTLTIPLYPKLTDTEVEYVAEEVIRAIAK